MITAALLLFVRSVLGAVMIYYGYAKVKDLRKNGADFDNMGFTPGMVWGTPVALIEFFGGIFIILGVLTPVVAVLFAIAMSVATIWKITTGSKNFSDYSYELLLVALSLSLLVTGPGNFSLLVFSPGLLDF